MKDFMMLFHSEPSGEPKPSSEDMKEAIKKWEDWIGGVAAQGKFKSTDALGYDGRTLHSDGTVTDGPYAEIKEIVGGYLICTTDTIEDALALAKGCPILETGGRVEVRDVMVF